MKIDLHIHSNYSPCSNLSLANILRLCQKNKIDAIAICDHNTISGAKKLKKEVEGKFNVVIGEEISTKEGHLIGLFLKKEIEPGFSAIKTAKEIKNQGGLVFIIHPFDFFRPNSLGKKALLKIIPYIDLVEIFNGRSLTPFCHKQALKFAQKHNLPTAVGSDAHTKTEMGRIYIQLEEFTTPDEFISHLKQSEVVNKNLLFYPYFFTLFQKIKKFLKF